MKKNVGWLGVLCLLGAGGLAVFVPWLTRLRWILVIAGAVLLLASLVLNAREAQGVLGRRGTRYGAGAAVMILLALGVAVFANALSSRHNVRWDFTENRRNTLSPQTVQVLKTLKTPVEAIAFFRTDTPGKRTAEDLLGQYAAQSGGKFTWRLEDTDKAPGLAREYGVESYGTVVIKGGGPDARTEKILDAEEEKLTNALVKVTRSGKRTVYVIKGHGEREVTNTEKAGFSQARDQMDRANYEVKELLLAREPTVPDDAAVVIVAGPRIDFFPQEVDALKKYLDKAGKLLLEIDPPDKADSPDATNLIALAHDWGMDVGKDIVVDASGMGRLIGTDASVPVVATYGSHPITENFSFVTAFPLARSVTPVMGGVNGHSAQPFAQTSAQSWAETDIKEMMTTGKVTLDVSKGDKKGPITIAAAVSAGSTAPAATDGSKPPDADAPKPETRVAVVGDSDFAANAGLGIQGNRDLFMNTIGWLSQQENLIAIRPKNPEDRRITLTATQQSNLTLLSLIVIPLCIFGSGVYAWSRRR